MKYIIIFLTCICTTAYSQSFKKVSKKTLNGMARDLTVDYNFYVVIKVLNLSENKTYLASITTYLLGEYYNDNINNNRDKAKRIKFIKSAIKGVPIIVKYDVVFKHQLRQYTISDSIYKIIASQPLEKIIKDNFNSDFKPKNDEPEPKFNSVVKILFDNHIEIHQEEFTGDFFISKSAFVKSVLIK
jgi:hypothetical protein